MNIEDILTVKAELDAKLGDYVNYYFTHKDIPLETRWAAYEKLNMLLPIDSWVSDNAITKTLGDGVSLYDDFNIEKYQTVRYAGFIEGLEDDIVFSAENPDLGESYQPGVSQEQVNLMKEHILASGKQGFIFDW